jgi:hypothetical protein
MHPEGHLRGQGHEMSIFLKVCKMISVGTSVGTCTSVQELFYKYFTTLIQRKINVEYLLASLKIIPVLLQKNVPKAV